MKRIGGLFDAIAERGTVSLATYRAARGKRQRGEIRQFLSRGSDEMARIVRELRTETFCFGKYRIYFS